MKIRLVCVGKVREPYVAAAVADFRRRLARYYTLDEIEVGAASHARVETTLQGEGRRILRVLEPNDVLWVLEREGSQLSSVELSERLQAFERDGVARLTLAIGGAYGTSEELQQRASLRWSLSRLTLLHEWTRALVLEQLYRAAKIARNEPYHH